MLEEKPWHKYKKKIEEQGESVKPWDFLNPNTTYASKEDSTNRLSICLTCQELIKLTRQCKQCGCFMELKTKLQDAKCPLGKW